MMACLGLRRQIAISKASSTISLAEVGFIDQPMIRREHRSMTTANDPGQKTPSPEEARQAAAESDDPRVVNTVKEFRPNIVHDFMKKDGAGSTL